MTQWYVMLFPSERKEHPIMRQMAEMVGGTPNPDPHVTINYFVPSEPDADLAAPLRGITGPMVTIRASEPFNRLWRPESPDTSRNILLHVEASPELRWWHDAVTAALSPRAVPAWPTWGDVRLHLHAVMAPTTDPPAALALLSIRPWAVEFLAERLVVSRRSGDTFTVVLDQPLDGGSRLRRWSRLGRSNRHRAIAAPPVPLW